LHRGVQAESQLILHRVIRLNERQSVLEQVRVIFDLHTLLDFWWGCRRLWSIHIKNHWPTWVVPILNMMVAKHQILWLVIIGSSLVLRLVLRLVILRGAVVVMVVIVVVAHVGMDTHIVGGVAADHIVVGGTAIALAFWIWKGPLAPLRT
jgi:hypothetical protein